jgi:hypothetical protein
MRADTKLSERRRRPRSARERAGPSIAGALAPRSGAPPEPAMGGERSEPGVDP